MNPINAEVLSCTLPPDPRPEPPANIPDQWAVRCWKWIEKSAYLPGFWSVMLYNTHETTKEKAEQYAVKFLRQHDIRRVEIVRIPGDKL